VGFLVAFGDWGPLLSRLYRKAEALDGACLRAWGHPQDHAVRDELLSALEWDSSLRPDHAPVIRELFVEVHDHSVDLSMRIRATADSPEGAARLLSDRVQSLRQRLAALLKALEARRAAPRTD
jgi:hypothetical protein